MKHLYICGCTPDGGVYHYTCRDGEYRLQDKLPLDRPTYMVIRGNQAYIVLRETDPARRFGGLLVCDIAPDGSLRPTGESQSSLGIVPCHLDVQGDDVYLANYLSGNVVKMPYTVRTHEGHGPNARRQDMAHTHFVTVNGAEVLCTDLGRDVIAVYDRALTHQYDIVMPAGCGPRHLAFAGERLLCINELACSVTLLEKQSGHWVPGETVPLLDEVTEKDTAAAIRVDGNRVYASIRGADVVVTLTLTDKGLKREAVLPCGGESPRDILVWDGQLYCANEGGTVTALPITAEGLETARWMADIPGALCLCGIDR